MFRYHPLSPKEEAIISHGNTEAPNSGVYTHFKNKGIFILL